MNTIDLIDAELRPLLALFPERPLSLDTLAEARTRMLPIPPADATGVATTSATIPSRSGGPDIGVRIYKPQGDAALPCIFHIHGGGYVMGSAESVAPVYVALAGELGCAIVSVDYRLAPETTFPGNVEDCYDALAWTFAHAEAEGFDPARIGVRGESAGGGLAAALALLVRDRGEFALAFQQLIYPMLDDRTGTLGEPNPHAGEFMWTAQDNRFGWTSLLGTAPGDDDVSIYAAAARATDLTGLPPTFLCTGAIDLFIDEDIAYAGRLIRAGVPVELHVYPGAFHGFDLAPDARISANARRDMTDALRRFIRA